MTHDRLKPVLLVLIRVGLFDLRHRIRLVEPAAEVDKAAAVTAEWHGWCLLKIDRGVADRTQRHGRADPLVGQSDFFSGFLSELFLSPPPSAFLPESAAAAFL